MGCMSSKPRLEGSGIRGVEREQEPAPVPRVKLVLLGNSGVGKSCLVLRYVRGQFDPSSKVTVGAAFMAHAVHLPDGHVVKFEIWDTAGQERYSSLAPLYYRGAAAAAVVYDITDLESFSKAKHWVRELQKNAANNIVIIFVGNKTDLAEDRQVDAEEARSYAESNGMLFMESSAKTAANVAQIFESVAQTLVGREAASAASPAPAIPQSSPAKLPTSTSVPSSAQGLPAAAGKPGSQSSSGPNAGSS